MYERKLEDWLKGYMYYTSFNEAPDMFHFWAGVGTLAGALRRKVYIDQEYFLWTPNFYIIFVAPPGIATKSTTMNAGMNILREVDGIKFGPNSITWQALCDSLEAACEMVDLSDDPRDPNFVPMSCLTFASSEFGSLLEPKDRKMMDILVDLWDGQTGAWEKVTKMSGNNTIQNPWLNILACTTPSWLADNMPRHMIGGGFTSRCVFVYGDRKRNLVPYPKRSIPEKALQIKSALIHDLEIVSMLKGEYTLSPEVLDYGTWWYKDQYENPPRELASNPQFQGYLARKQGHVHKLAMVLSASRSNSLVIEIQDFQTAITIMSAMEKDLPKVFKAINTTPFMEQVEYLISLVRQRRRVDKYQLYQEVFLPIMKIADYNEALDSAIQAGLIRQIGEGTQVILTPADTPFETPGTAGSIPSASEAPAPEDSQTSADPSRSGEDPAQKS